MNGGIVTGGKRHLVPGTSIFKVGFLKTKIAKATTIKLTIPKKPALIHIFETEIPMQLSAFLTG